MKSLLDDISSQVIDFSFKLFKKKKNQDKIKYIIANITNYAFQSIKPYLYTIIILLVTMFFINCAQFYYYMKIKHVLQYSN
jgi:hypothetical protein|uniref:Uncharacterized protein n=1 Tax=viral metagenome TaxID=1070528 RepID=A0A6C0DWM9_9ZZZZ